MIALELTQEQWEIVWANRKLAYKVARRFIGRGVLLEDLEQEALLGLAKAVAAHDPSKGSLGNLAWTACRWACNAAIDRGARSVSYPVGTGLDRARVMRVREQLRRAGQEPSEQQVVEASREHLGARHSHSRVVRLLRHDVRETRLDEPDALGRPQTLPDSSQGADEHVEGAERTRLIAEALATLPERDAEVLRLSCGLNEDGEALTGVEIGALLGISRQRVQQIRDRAIERLRTGPHARVLAYLWGEVGP